MLLGVRAWEAPEFQNVGRVVTGNSTFSSLFCNKINVCSD